MQVRYVGAQQFISGDGNHYFKLFYSVPPDSATTRFTDDSGAEATVRYVGERVFHIKCTADAIAAAAKIKPGSVVRLNLQPNPAKPRENIVFGFLE